MGRYGDIYVPNPNAPEILAAWAYALAKEAGVHRELVLACATGEPTETAVCVLHEAVRDKEK